jgi:glycosyltransferase involved in cell wall biosynthesis
MTVGDWPLVVGGSFFLIALVNALFFPALTRKTASGRVSILIPARNEEANLPDCLIAAVATSAAEIVVCDDHSTDGTAGVVQAFAGLDPRVRLIRAPVLPDGWYGKPFACRTLAGAARGEWLLFLDADTYVAPDAPACMVAECVERRLTFLSCWPTLEMPTWVESGLMPALNFAVFSIFPGPLSLVLDSPSLGLAHGACIMAHAGTYRKLGGHDLVRNEIFEDTRLAQLWRKQGERGLCVDAAGSVRVRMYDSFGGIWRGFQKNFFPAFRFGISFVAFLALHAGVFLALFFLSWKVALTILAARLVLAIRFNQPLVGVIAHPFSEGVLVALGISSWWKCATGRGVAWKGRVYKGRNPEGIE